MVRATGNVGRAAEAVGVTRTTAYHHRDEKCNEFDPDFKDRWDDAIEAWVDDLEEEGYRRAYGELEPVVQGGRVVMIRDRKTKKMVPLSKKKASDLLAIFLLKGNRTKYRDSLDVTSGGASLADQAAAAKTTLLSRLFPKAKAKP